MSVLLRLAARNLSKERARTLITAAGVALSAALFAGAALVGVSLLNYMANGAAKRYGGWHAEFPSADAAFAAAQETDARVADVASLAELGYAELPGAKGQDKPYLFLAGFDDKAFSALPLTLLAGHLPESDSELLLPSHALGGENPFAVGDELTLAVGRREAGGEALSQLDALREGEAIQGAAARTYTVVGVYGRLRAEPERAPGMTAITRVADARVFPNQTVLATLADAADAREYAEGTGRAYRLNEEVLRFYGLAGGGVFRALLFTVGALVLVLVMTGSVFLIYNAFNISLGARTRQLGVLMSVGATARQLRALVLLEGALLGLLGIPAGLLLGVGGAKLVLAAVERNLVQVAYGGVPLSLAVPAPALLAAAAVSLVTLLLSAYLPARKASRANVLSCLKGADELAVSPKDARPSPLARCLLGFEGTLALRNLRRSRRRCRGVVLSLSLSVILLISVGAFSGFLRQASEMAVAFTTYDVGVSVPGVGEETLRALLPRLSACEGVTHAALQTERAYRVRVRAGDLAECYWQGETPPGPETPVSLEADAFFLDDASYAEICYELGMDAGAGAPLPAVAVMSIDDGRSHDLADFDSLFAAPSLTLALSPRGDGSQTREAAVSFRRFVPPDSLPSLAAGESLPYYFVIAAPRSMLDALDTGEAPRAQGFTFSSASPTKTAAEMEEILTAAGVGHTVYDVYGMLEENRSLIAVIDVFSAAFTALMSLIACANVTNTVATNLRLRRRELAMLRSAGMGERAFSRMLRFECAFYGARALFFGLPLSAAATALIYLAMSGGGADNVRFAVPWPSVAASAAGVFAVVFLAMAYASARIRRENILDALRDETL